MNNEEKIIKTLKDFGRVPTARLAAITGIDYYYIIDILRDMASKGKVICDKETKATYWRLPGGKE